MFFNNKFSSTFHQSFQKASGSIQEFPGSFRRFGEKLMKTSYLFFQLPGLASPSVKKGWPVPGSGPSKECQIDPSQQAISPRLHS